MAVRLMVDDECIQTLKIHREQVALDYVEAYNVMTKEQRAHSEKVMEALNIVLDALDTFVGGVCVTLPCDGTYGLVRKVDGEYKVETGKIGKWLE